MRESVREGHALGLFVEGTRQLNGVPGQVQPRRRDGRAPGGRSGRPRRDLRLVRLEARQLASDLGRVGRAAAVRGAAEEREGLSRGLRRIAEPDPPPARLARRDARARPAPARDPTGMSEDDRETPEVQQPEIIGTVAIVGFPNVGKSTLINRLTESRQAVVHETPGVTRDRKELLADWNGKHFLLIDTGGVDDLATDPFSPEIAKQARAAIREADLVLFVVDARHGITPGDEELAVTLRASKKPVIVLANKIDDPRKDLEAVEFHKLGLGDPFPLSALHGHGTGDLLDRVVDMLPGEGPVQVGDEAIRVAILAQPERGQVVAPERTRRRGARDRLGRAGDDARHRRHDPRARRAHLPAGRHGRPAAEAEAAPGDRLLLRTLPRSSQ